MDEDQDAEYSYSIARGAAGAGMTVWRWTVSRCGSKVPIHQGTSIRSRDDARRSALEVISRLKRRRDGNSG